MPASPIQTRTSRLIGREVLGLNEFLFQGFEGVVLQLELDLERPIRHALTLTEEGNHLIEDRVKVHARPSLPVVRSACMRMCLLIIAQGEGNILKEAPT